jgi:MFS family permease
MGIDRRLFRIPVLVAALGYLVDMYDLFLFTIVRVPSLKSLQVSGDKLLSDGVLLLNLQMAGMLIGGLVWGIMGDKKGRLSVLFGSILIYSLANIGNGFVTNVTGYAVMRFIAGFGLAGELGVGVTLVVEILPKELRGYGTTIVATMGVFGALLAYLIVHFFFWRVSYFIGGGLGLLLMILRIRVLESTIFLNIKSKKVSRGDILMILKNRSRFLRYINSILIGMPIWFIAGILITFSPEFGEAMKIGVPINAGQAVLFTFGGQVAGNILSGMLSQYLKSRKKAILVFLLFALLSVFFYLLFPSEVLFYSTSPALFSGSLGVTGLCLWRWRQSSSAPTCGLPWRRRFQISCAARSSRLPLFFCCSKAG